MNKASHIGTSTPSFRNPKAAYNLRRNILDPKIIQDVSGSNEKDVGESSKLIKDLSLESQKTNESHSRYNLRNSAERNKENSVFYKSVLTPSRAKRQSITNPQKFRTPHIYSTRKEPYSTKTNAKVPQAIRKKWKEDCRKILKKSWKFCYLSSMTGFKYESKNLRLSYERTLKNRSMRVPCKHVVKSRPTGHIPMLVETRLELNHRGAIHHLRRKIIPRVTDAILELFPSYHLTVEINPSSFLKQQPKQYDSIFLKVTSFTPQPSEEEEDKVITVYESILIKVDETQSLAVSGVEWFPLYLYSGIESIHVAVITWLQASFGCYITMKGVLPVSTILFVSAIWTHGSCKNKSHKNEDVNLQYLIRPSDPRVLGPQNEGKKVSFKVKFLAKDLDKTWAKIKNIHDEKLNFEQISKFHSVLEGYVEALTSIPKSFLHLNSVQTSCISLSPAGRLRMSCDQTFLAILNHLTEVFLVACNFRTLDQLDRLEIYPTRSHSETNEEEVSDEEEDSE